jgi:hypothetical protein
MICAGGNAYGHPTASGRRSGGVRSGSLSHAGILFSGWEHGRAATAEGVIAIVLAVAGVAAWNWPQRARYIAPAALAFAFLGTLVGAVTIAVGIGPQTRADLVLHALLLLGLALGLVTTWPKRTPP